MFLITLLTYNMPMDDESWSVWSLPLSGKIIVVDAGHGGLDGGAKSKGGIIEKDITLPISMYLRDFLQEAGALVIMTRETDTDLAAPGTKGLSKRKTEDLLRRVRLIKDNQADLLISIHLNAIPSPRWSGAQTFYSPALKQSGQMAHLIQDEIKRVISNTDRVAKKTDDIFILRTAECPSVLVEVGFLSNEQEAKLMATSRYQKQMANAIYQGILRYYSGETVEEMQ
ncbi:N-acetylmuramoyl-L-alanine amidase [Aneurinibacillus sp. XH2]|uniref:N-acetylmuramoyl-L-alanine amidase CwlD n=1 Tax=Aneurinibacillus sp. XH2 TaxID=1450761 RepID=UPI00070F7930|nr:N-acetylmuramoyl-L-alanine amidase [Aneurinibacillus sp. XH2]